MLEYMSLELKKRAIVHNGKDTEVLMNTRNTHRAAKPAQIKIAGAWRIAVSARNPAGAVSATLNVPPPDIVVVTDEKYAMMPEFNPKAWGGWIKGLALRLSLIHI